MGRPLKDGKIELTDEEKNSEGARKEICYYR